MMQHAVDIRPFRDHHHGHGDHQQRDHCPGNDRHPLHQAPQTSATRASLILSMSVILILGEWGKINLISDKRSGLGDAMLTHYLNIWLPAAGVVFLVFAYLVKMATDHLQARHWPQTTGKVVESAVDEERGDSLPRASFAKNPLHLLRGRQAAGESALRFPCLERLTGPSRGHRREIPRRLGCDRLSPPESPGSGRFGT